MREVVQQIKGSIGQEMGFSRCGLEKVKQCLENGLCWVWHIRTLINISDKTWLGISSRDGTCRCDRIDEGEFCGLYLEDF